MERGVAMILQILIAALFVITTVTVATVAEIVTFKGEDQEILAGGFARSEGKGPFPAHMLLHGYIGIDKYYDVCTERLAGWVTSPCE